MKKTIYLAVLAASVAFASCNSEKSGEDLQDPTGSLQATVFFTKSEVPQTYADNSTGVPSTDWSNIKQVQAFFYNASNTVVYSEIFTPSAGNTTFTWNGIPVGTYTVKLVANAISTTDAVQTYLDAVTASVFDKFIVRTKNIANMSIRHQPRTAPSWSSISGAFFEPIAEVFTASATGITISTGITNDTQLTGVNAMKLQRVVSLMRVRVAPKPDSGISINDDVVFAKAGGAHAAESSVVLHNIPNQINIIGAATNASTRTNIVVGAESGAWDNSNSNIALGIYKYYKEIMVMPTNGTEEATQYFIVISAWAPEHHKLSDGSEVGPSGARVYWSGWIKAGFTANVVREVNIKLQTGGTTTEPTPTSEGSLKIELGALQPWDSNIQAIDIEM